MKNTKKIGKVIASTVLPLAVLCVFWSNVAILKQSLEISATPDKVFERINRPANWAEWYTPLFDPSGVKIRFTGTAAGKGAGMKWGSGTQKAGGGMKIRQSKNNRKVKAVVAINELPAVVMTFKMKPASRDATMLSISARLQFGQENFFRWLFDRSDKQKIIGGLENIFIWKINEIDVSLQRIESFSYISILDSCLLEEVGHRINSLYNELMLFGVNAGIDISVRPIAVYHQLDEEKSVFELGIPVVEQTPVSGRILYKTMPQREHVVANFFGPFDRLEEGHNAAQQWITRYRRKLTGYPWEMYVTDPAVEPDPSKWLTRIYYPVE